MTRHNRYGVFQNIQVILEGMIEASAYAELGGDDESVDRILDDLIDDFAELRRQVDKAELALLRQLQKERHRSG